GLTDRRLFKIHFPWEGRDDAHAGVTGDIAGLGIDSAAFKGFAFGGGEGAVLVHLPLEIADLGRTGWSRRRRWGDGLRRGRRGFTLSRGGGVGPHQGRGTRRGSGEGQLPQRPLHLLDLTERTTLCVESVNFKLLL